MGSPLERGEGCVLYCSKENLEPKPGITCESNQPEGCVRPEFRLYGLY